MQDERVPLLRERLGLPAVRGRPVLRQAARRRGRAVPEGKGPAGDRPADARRPSTPSTASATSATTDIIMANMERWRWVPRDLGKAHVVLNIPDFTLRVYNNGAHDLADPRRGRQARHADAAPVGDDEVHHRQPDLERAAVDRLQRIPAGAAAGPDRAQAHGPEAGAERRRQRAHLAAAGRGATRSAASASTSRTSSWSISTTRRTSTCSRTTKRAYSHGCMRVQDPDKYAEVLLGIALPKDRLHARTDQEHVRPLRDRHPLPDADPGPHHLPDRVRGRRRQAADPRRRLRPRRPRCSPR